MGMTLLRRWLRKWPSDLFYIFNFRSKFQSLFYTIGTSCRVTIFNSFKTFLNFLQNYLEYQVICDGSVYFVTNLI